MAAGNHGRTRALHDLQCRTFGRTAPSSQFEAAHPSLQRSSGVPATADNLAGFGYRAQTDTVDLPPDVRADLEWVRDDFDQLVSNAATVDLDAPTRGTKWTNRELLFHLWFGQRLARTFMPLIGGFSRLPPGASRAWARLLARVTKPYEWVNYIASAGGGRLVPIRVIQAWMRRDTDAMIRWAERASPADLARGMSVPPSWDPYFLPWMNRTDLLAWAPKHYRHHRAQLTLGST